MSEQAPQEYHRTIERHFVTDGVDIGRMKNTDLTRKVAESEDEHRRYHVTETEEGRLAGYKILTQDLVFDALKLQTADVNRAIARRAAGWQDIHPENALNNAYEESSKVVADHARLKNAVAKENARLASEFRKADTSHQ